MTKFTAGTVDAAEAPLLDVTGLTTTFVGGRQPVTAVADVSLTLRRGETLGVVGESGSGKSVLSRSIMGLVSPGSRVVRTGTIVFDGTDITALSRKKVRRLWGSQIGMVLQDPLTSLNPVKKIGAQLMETVRKHAPETNRAEAAQRSIELLRSVGIPEPAKRMRVYAHQMSGGMRQRVGIAIALAGNPQLLLADEPTTALDVTVQMQILDLLQRQQRERNMGMVLVTHDLGVVATRTDRIMVMYAGQVVESAPTRVLFEDMRMPYTRALLDALPRRDDPSHTRLRAIPGNPPNLAAPPVGCRFAARCPAVQERCRVEAPPLLATPERADHLYRCWYPVGSPEYARAVMRNAADASAGAMPPATTAPGADAVGVAG
ncbi:ABC transporter ATP-binding protein [Microbacterium sp. zg.Y909]|uniref:ABC transporter ATP-binding protein n=1 Tax=Microbacterium sp. zg.Y909 TaxID=2969413 RepID=UPI00214B56EA|nr:ABC transporter ATP-binding protein [Microbacterium sp. zg.Y909]MCR2824101.1 ABC transporter ATP-binding protein [Microbacterium sp. zg.Y909]